MPKTTLAERALLVRKELGYGGTRDAAAFARKLGIKASSLHDIESGKTLQLGKSLKGYIAAGVNPDYLEKGSGPRMLFQQIERKLQTEQMASLFDDLDDEKRHTVMELVRQLRRAQGGPPDAKDPFRADPPKEPDTQ